MTPTGRDREGIAYDDTKNHSFQQPCAQRSRPLSPSDAWGYRPRWPSVTSPNSQGDRRAGNAQMTQRRSSAGAGRHSERDRLTFHRKGNKSLFITREPGSPITASAEIAQWIDANKVRPSVTCRCRMKEQVDEGEQLLTEPAEVFSPVRRPVRHTDSQTGVSLHMQQTEAGAFAVWGESGPEEHTSVLLSQQLAVRTHVTQFTRLLWDTPLGHVEHYPDVLVELRNDDRLVLDVRPRGRWDSAFLAKAYMTAQWAHGLGIRYGIVDSSDVASVKVRLEARRFRDAGDPIAAAAQILWEIGLNAPGAFVEDLARHGGIDLPIAKPAILSLVAQGRAVVNVWSQFDHSSQVHCFLPTGNTLHDMNITWGYQLQLKGASL